jgi:hypothetical protein
MSSGNLLRLHSFLKYEQRSPTYLRLKLDSHSHRQALNVEPNAVALEEIERGKLSFRVAT